MLGSFVRSFAVAIACLWLWSVFGRQCTWPWHHAPTNQDDIIIVRPPITVIPLRSVPIQFHIEWSVGWLNGAFLVNDSTQVKVNDDDGEEEEEVE